MTTLKDVVTTPKQRQAAMTTLKDVVTTPKQRQAAMTTLVGSVAAAELEVFLATPAVVAPPKPKKDDGWGGVPL